MKTLQIDEKWSIKYDPENNDNPCCLRRYGDCACDNFTWSNPVIAMFYALLEARQVRNESAEADRPMVPDFATMATEIHADNVKAGWWTDIKTGESTLYTRNRPEMLMLAVSELAEAAEGANGMMDDKLRHLPMYDVELADFVIRQLDQIGAEVSCGEDMPSFGLSVPTKRLRPMSRVDRLNHLVGEMAQAMENYRKGRKTAYVQVMADAVFTAFQIAEIEHIDLIDIIAQKRAFNATRADHQIANRLKEGGKAF